MNSNFTHKQNFDFNYLFSYNMELLTALTNKTLISIISNARSMNSLFNQTNGKVTVSDTMIPKIMFSFDHRVES